MAITLDKALIEQYSQITKALANRFEILERLAQRSYCVWKI
jgi:hypothetical protein